MGWKSKFVPMFRMVFDRNAGKKTSAAEACKAFEASKDSYNEEFEERKAELRPKVLEIYEASSADIKTFAKERTEASLKKHSSEVQSFLEELVKIDFPGSQAACEASSKFGATHVLELIDSVFEKVSTLVTTEKKEAGAEASPPTKTEEATGDTEREVIIEEGKEEEKEEEVEEKKEEAEEVTEKTEKRENEENKKPVEPATEAPAMEEEKPADQPAAPAAAAAPAPAEIPAPAATPAIAATLEEKTDDQAATGEEEKPAESVVAVTSESDEADKKIEEKVGIAGQATKEAGHV